MADAPTLTPGGLARDANGKPADMPRDLAGSLNGDLMDVAALIHAAKHLADDNDN